MNQKTDQRIRLTLRQLEVFAAVARGGTTRAAADEISRSQSAASNALGELEQILGVQLFDRVSKKLLINENGRALLSQAVSILEQALEVEHLFGSDHAAPLRLASSYTIGEYLLPGLIAAWKAEHPKSHVRLEIANTHDVFQEVTSFRADIGFIEGAHSHPELTVRSWRTDELLVIASPGYALTGRRATARQLQDATWVLREQGSGTREASDRWLIPNLPRMEVDLELGSNEAVKRAVGAGMGLGCLSRLAVKDALEQGWLVEVPTSLPPMQRSLSIVLHRSKRLGAAAQSFLDCCLAAQ